MYAASAAAGINGVERENMGAAEIESIVLIDVATFLMPGQMVVALVIKEVEIQTWGKPFTTVDVMTPASALASNLSLDSKAVCLTIFLHSLCGAP